MGIGHLAASFALRSRFPRVPLFYLLAAAGFVDLLWGIAILTGLEKAHLDPASPSAIPLVLDSVPYTHSLVAGLLWGALVGVAWWLWRKDGAGALVLGALVVSHWVLDFVSHLPDVPLYPGGEPLGLGLWRSRVGSLVVEVGMFLGGIAIYARTTRANDGTGSRGLVIFAALVTIVGASAFYSPPPPSVLPMAALNLFTLVPLFIADWIDRHRTIATV